MFLYIAIVFIAELIIAGTIVFHIIKLDKKVTELNNTVIEQMPAIKTAMKDISSSVDKTAKTVAEGIGFIKRKQCEFPVKALQHILTFAVFLFGRGRYKKAAAILELVSAIALQIRKCSF
ncbi:hypothetical protein J6E39_04240 [bacterium]|nr:hypothetical protein [bacterium]